MSRTGDDSRSGAGTGCADRRRRNRACGHPRESTHATIAGAAILALVGVIAAAVWEVWRSAKAPAWSGSPLGVSLNASTRVLRPTRRRWRSGPLSTGNGNWQ